MLTRKKPGSADWTDPDDAPRLTGAMREQAEVFEGDRFAQRGRGRPKSPSPKTQVNIRLDTSVVEALRRSGPGWQSRTAAIVKDKLEETELPSFDFPLEVAVTLPSGETLRRAAVVIVTAPDRSAAIEALTENSGGPTAKPPMVLRWNCS